MDPLGSGDHFASALRAAGIAVRRDDVGGTWSVDSADPAAVVESFFACARERAQNTADDPLRLADEDSDLMFYEAYWEDSELVVTLRRQFALLEDGEDEEYLDRLHLELRTRSAPAETPESAVIEGAGGSDATVDEWARRLRSDSAFAAMLTVPLDVVRFDQGPI
jgi:hypothetical protein